MKKIMLAGIFLLSHFANAQAATIGFDANDVTVNLNDRFTLNVLGSGFTDGITGGGLNLSFSAANLFVENVTINTAAFDFLPQTGSIDNVNG
ncbi:MAG: hypothetical protein ABW095_17545, partial [Candidatus Thiodiazotropha sp.]